MDDVSSILSNKELTKLLEDVSGKRLLEILLLRIAQLSHDLGIANQAAHEANITKTNFAQTLNHLVYQLNHQTQRCKELEEKVKELQEEIELLRD